MLNSLFRKKKSFAGLLSSTDVHSHLLPGIDDGVATIEESLEVIRGFKQLGYSKLITTPHIMHDFYKNSPENILPKLEEVREALSKAEIDIQIEASAEYYLDEHFIELIDADKPLLSFAENYVLFELSFVSKPMTLRDVIFKLQTKSYKPVLAHPERYLYFHKNIDELKELVDAGTILQLNLLSLSGYYSNEVKKMAIKLIDNNLISLIGTDCHNQRQFDAVSETLDSPIMNKLINSNLINSNL